MSDTNERKRYVSGHGKVYYLTEEEANNRWKLGIAVLIIMTVSISVLLFFASRT